MHAWWVTNNLSFLTGYWNTAQHALRRVVEAPETFPEFEANGLDRAYVEAVISGHLETHNYASLLLVFANWEEVFTVLCTDLGRTRGVAIEPSDLRDRGVQRFHKFIYKACLVNETDLKIDWAFLRRLATIRNCLIHSNGSRGRSADPKSLDAVVEAYPSELVYLQGGKLRVSDEFVARSIRETGRASMNVVNYLIAQSKQAVPPTENAGG